MAAKNASHAPTDDPGRDKQPARGRDGRKTAQHDRRTDATNNSPPHGHVSHGFGAFLSWLHPGTPFETEVLSEKYDYWANADSPRDDPAATWDALEGWLE